MRVFLFVISYMLSPLSFGVEVNPSCGSGLPWEIESSLSSGSATVTHFTLQRDVGPNIWRRRESCLEVSQPDASWWVPRLADGFFEIGEYIDDQHLLVIAHHITTKVTHLLDLDKRELHFIGVGAGSYIRVGENAGLILLRGQKRYRHQPGAGAFWLDALVDLNGEVVEFMPSEFGECLNISEILGIDEPRGKLRQKITECVRVVS